MAEIVWGHHDRDISHNALSKGNLGDRTFPEGFLLVSTSNIYLSACTVFSRVFINFDDQKKNEMEKPTSKSLHPVPPP